MILLKFVRLPPNLREASGVDIYGIPQNTLIFQATLVISDSKVGPKILYGWTDQDRSGQIKVESCSMKMYMDEHTPTLTSGQNWEYKLKSVVCCKDKILIP